MKYEIYEIKNCGKQDKQKNLKYKTKKYILDFQQYEAIRSFGGSN